MIVVSDTSPINYLLLIDQLDLLPRLFQQIIIPDVVRDEMLDLGAPPVLQQWISDSPPWLTVQAVSVIDETLSALDPEEQAAITICVVREPHDYEGFNNRWLPNAQLPRVEW